MTLGDVIVDVDGRSINGEADLFKALDRKRPGDSVKVTVAREARAADGAPDDVATARVPVDIVLGAAHDVARGVASVRAPTDTAAEGFGNRPSCAYGFVLTRRHQRCVRLPPANALAPSRPAGAGSAAEPIHITSPVEGPARRQGRSSVSLLDPDALVPCK